MCKNIVKVIFDDNTELTIGEIKTKEQIKQSNDYYDTDWKIERAYNRQFNQIERDVLKELNDDNVIDYAIEYLDLIEENDCDCPEEKYISDFDDSEILSEAIHRKIIPVKTDIITMSLLDRMLKVLDVADREELNQILEKLEQKHFII
jgi:hypothetical protein